MGGLLVRTRVLRRLLSRPPGVPRRVPGLPVGRRSRDGLGSGANGSALALAGIPRDTPAPDGGEIRKDANGDPTGLVLNRAVPLLDNAVPRPAPAQRDAQLMRALSGQGAQSPPVSITHA